MTRPANTPIEPMSHKANPTGTNQTYTFCASRLLRTRLPQRRPRRRTAPAEPMITMPAITPSNWTLRRMSPFRIWLNSCATTPCNSSRFKLSSAPRVTMTVASLGEKPAAKALIERSLSITHARGTPMPEASAISSTILRSRRS